MKNGGVLELRLVFTNLKQKHYHGDYYIMVLNESQGKQIDVAGRMLARAGNAAVPSACPCCAKPGNIFSVDHEDIIEVDHSYGKETIDNNEELSTQNL